MIPALWLRIHSARSPLHLPSGEDGTAIIPLRSFRTSGPAAGASNFREQPTVRCAMKKLHCGIVLLCAGLLGSVALADTLELKNGSVIKGTYVGGNENQISFRVGANVQQYDVADISALRFDSRESGRSREFAEPQKDSSGFSSRSDRDSDNSRRSTNVSTMTVPTRTRCLVRTIE